MSDATSQVDDVDFGKVLWLGEMAKIEFAPGDTFVLFYPRMLSREAADRLKRMWQENFPGHKCVVLEEGMRLGILAPAAQAEDQST